MKSAKLALAIGSNVPPGIWTRISNRYQVIKSKTYTSRMDSIVNPAKELASMSNGSLDGIFIRNVNMDSVNPEVGVDGHGLRLSSCFLGPFQIDIRYH